MTISLGEFVKYLVLLLQKNGIDLLFHKQEAWHRLFYRLKKSPEIPGKPAFLEKLWFDWDGPYPDSPELSQYLNSLLRLGVVQTNSPRFDKYWLPKEIKELWQRQFDILDGEIRQYLNSIVEVARKEFSKVFSQT